MDNNQLIRKITNLQNRYDEEKQSKSRAEGQLRSLFNRLKTEHKSTTLSSGEKKALELKEQATSAQIELEKQVTEFENKYEW